jgi:hypothetical protein
VKTPRDGAGGGVGGEEAILVKKHADPAAFPRKRRTARTRPSAG